MKLSPQWPFSFPTVYVAPPDYFTIFGQIREAREESRNHLAFLGRVGQIILNTGIRTHHCIILVVSESVYIYTCCFNSVLLVGCTVLLLVFMSVPITILALGKSHTHSLTFALTDIPHCIMSCTSSHRNLLYRRLSD